jgi:HEAT repeat protein
MLDSRMIEPRMKDLQKLIEELTCGDEQRAEAVVLRIADFGEEAAVLLQELTNHPDAEVRWWALRAMTEIPSERSKNTLLSALGDDDQGVRYCAVVGLRQLPTAEAIPTLIDLLNSPDQMLARLASDALIHNGEEAVPALLAAMENGPHNARLEAVRALAHIGDKRSIPELFSALEEGSAMLEYWANEGLEKMGIGMVFFKP